MATVPSPPSSPPPLGQSFGGSFGDLTDDEDWERVRAEAAAAAASGDPATWRSTLFSWLDFGGYFAPTDSEAPNNALPQPCSSEEADKEVAGKGGSGERGFGNACEEGDLLAVRAFEGDAGQRGVGGPAEEGHTGLTLAARHDRVEVCRALIVEKGVDPNGRDGIANLGLTPLGWSIWYNNLEAASALGSLGADVESSAIGLRSERPLHLVESAEAIDLLIGELKADPNSRSDLGTAIHTCHPTLLHSLASAGWSAGTEVDFFAPPTPATELKPLSALWMVLRAQLPQR